MDRLSPASIVARFFSLTTALFLATGALPSGSQTSLGTDNARSSGGPLRSEAAAAAPVIVVTPESIGQSLLAGDTGTAVLSIRNDGDVSLKWQLALRHTTPSALSISPRFAGSVRVDKTATVDATAIPSAESVYVAPGFARKTVAPGDTTAARLPLQDVLDHLDSGFESVTRLIPDLHIIDDDFNDHISDGGDDMYDYGNYLSTDLGGSIRYSEGVIQSHVAVGPGGQYFTKMYPGLFCFSSDLVGVGAFLVTGELGADGGGTADGSILTARAGGIDYLAFVKRVSGTDDPSVNHLIIVEDNGQATHEFATNTNDDYHRVYNLAGATRIYYLLYASSEGGYVDDSRTMSILDAFLGVLSPSWLTADPVFGELAAGATANVTVGLSAANLFEGQYEGQILVMSDDPTSPEVSVPVSLSVDGDPDISASASALNFGDIYVGLSDTLGVTIFNDGTAPLVVSSVYTTGSGYSVDVSTPFSLTPEDSVQLRVAFTPPLPGGASGLLVIESDDPDESTLTVDLIGNGVDPPRISVSPTSVSEALDAGLSTIQTLTVSNAGGSDLDWMAITGSGDVVILADYSVWQEGLAEYLRTTGRFRSVEIVETRYSVPTLVQLQTYDAVVALTAFDENASAVGDVLADYVNSGGNLLVAVHANYGSRKIAGRFDEDGYWLIIPGTSIVGGSSLGEISVPGHPLMEGVNDVADQSHLPPGTKLAPNATLVASWADGAPMVAVNDSLWPGRRVDLSLPAYPDSWQLTDVSSASDAGRLFANALAWLAHDFLSVEPSHATISALSQSTADLTIDATDLMEGTYSGMVRFGSNDPATPEVEIPVTLSVSGVADISSIPESVDLPQVVVGSSQSAILYVRNSGTAVLSVSGVSVQGTGFTVSDATGFDLLPRASKPLTVEFAPTTTGPASGALVVSSDDPDEPTLTIALSGTGLPTPDISVSPTPIIAQVESGLATSHTLTVSNDGAGELNWSLDVWPGLSSGGSVGTPYPGGGATRRVLLLGTYGGQTCDQSCYDHVRDVEMYLRESGRFDSLETRWEGAGTPSLDDLLSYDVVGVFGYYPPTFLDALGDVLADYLDAGGSVVNAIAHRDRLGGRYAADGYDPILVNSFLRYSSGSSYEGTFHQPFHPILKSASLIRSRKFVDEDSEAAETALLIADFSNGGPAVVVKTTTGGGRHVGLGFQIVRSTVDYYGLYYGSDLVVNAFHWAAVNFVEASPTSGIVPASASADISLTLHGEELVEGVYRKTLAIGSNDPDESLTLVPVELSVTSDPHIVIDADTLRFDSLLVGLESTIDFAVSNDSTGFLEITGTTSSDVSFELATALPLRIPPFETRRLSVRFAPDRPGPIGGTLSISSNDPDSPTIELPAVGAGVAAPDIRVSPTELSVELEAGMSTSLTVTLENVGTGALDWQAHFDSLGPIAIMAATGAAQGADVVRHLSESGRFDSVAFIDGTARIPIVDELLQYDAVGVFATTNWRYGSDNIGDLLADYVDAGGNLLLAVGANNESSNGLLTGRFDTGGYWLLGPAAIANGTFEMDTIEQPDHPIMANVHEFTSTRKMVNTAAVAPATDVLAHYDDGTPLVAVSHTTAGGHRVDLPFQIFTTAVNIYGLDDASEETRLVANAFQWMINDYGRVLPMAGTTEAGGSDDIGVHIDASRLGNGTYEDGVAIRSNDPDTPVFHIPLTVTVGGEPDLDLSVTSMEFGDVFAGGSSERSLTVRNNGGVPLDVTALSLTGSGFSIDSENPFTLSPFDSTTRVVTFAPPSIGTFAGQIDLSSNDPDTPSATVALSGTGIPAPVLDLESSEISAEVAAGATAVRLLTVGNPGGNDLEWSISLGSPPSLSVVESSITFGGEVSADTPAVYRSSPLVFSIEPEMRRPQKTSVEVISTTSTPRQVLLSEEDSRLITDSKATVETTVLASSVSTAGLPSLEIALDSLDNGSSVVESLIPDMARFDGGFDGTSIDHPAGYGMFEEGNILSTDLGGPIPYSDRRIVNNSALGESGRYFTLKSDGMFVLAADLDGVSSFHVAGQIWSYATHVDGVVLQTVSRGVRYAAFVKRVYREDGGSSPSVNHIIIVAEPEGATHSFPTDPRNDGHVVDGIGGSARIYFLLFSRRNTRYVDEIEMTRILNGFLGVLGSDWLKFRPTAGILPPTERTVVDVVFDGSHLDAGAHTGIATMYSNDPTRRFQVITASALVDGQRPEAGADSYTTDEDIPIRLTVLDNDSDPGGGSLSLVTAADPAHGSIEMVSSDTLLYTPDPDFYGVDTFTYEVTNGTTTAYAAVEISVRPVNDAPRITSEPTTEVDEERTYVYQVVANDPEGAALYYYLPVAPAWLSVNTTGRINGTPPRAARDTVVTVVVQDEAGAEASQSYSIDVVNVDYDAPLLLSAATNPSSIDLTSGPVPLTVSANLVDSLSGVVSVDLAIAFGTEPPLSAQASLVDGTASEGRWESTILVPWSTATGDWILSVVALDQEDNRLETSTSTSVHIQGGDTEGPTVVSAGSVTPSEIDITNGSREVVVAAPLGDNLSGIESAWIRLADLQGSVIESQPASRVSGSDINGVWQATFQIELADGNYSFTSRTVDVAGNESIYEVGASLRVVLPLPDLAAGPSPFDGELQVSARPSVAWTPARGARTYEIFAWPEGQERPTEPVHTTEIPGSSYWSGYLNHLAFGRVYRWQVVSVNPTGRTEGPEWTFTVMNVPDLEVTGLEAPATGQAGSEVEVVFTVDNSGVAGTRAPAWNDELYLSVDDDLDRSVDTRLIVVKNLSALEAGGGYTNRITARLPEREFGSSFLILNTDAGNSETEADELNNLAVFAIEIEIPPSPDVQIDGLIAPRIVFSGTSPTLRWMVRNTGAGRTRVDSWYDDVYLSEDDILQESTDTRLDRVRTGRVMLPGDSLNMTQEIRFPDGISGEYFIIMEADVRDEVFEPLAESNNLLVKPVTVSLSPPPDLVLTAAEPKSEMWSGQPFSLEWTITNEGPGMAQGPWEDRVYVSASTPFDQNGATVLGAFPSPRNLEPDSSYTNTRSVVIPFDLRGPVHLFVETDWKDAVYEYVFEDNNVGAAGEATSQISPWPDLQIAGSSLPEAAEAGRRLPASWTVRNVGAAATRTGWTDTVYVSPGSTWSRTTARVVGFAVSPRALNASEQLVQVAHGVVPEDLSGSYFVFVYADARDQVFENTDENNNVLGAGQIQIVPIRMPDLGVSDLSFETDTKAGQDVNIQWTVTNNGRGTATSTRWTDRVYLSRDDVFSENSDVLLGEVGRSEPLPAGGAYTRSAQMKIPEYLFGDYFVFIHTDATQSTEDANRSDNVVMAASTLVVEAFEGPDLVFAETVEPLEGVAGRSMSISWTVRNAGAGATSQQWLDRVYLSGDSRLGFGDIRYPAQQGPEGLAVDATYTRDVDLEIPPWASGTHYLIYTIDDDDNLFESIENNNVQTRSITISLPAPADLVVSDVSAPASATPGELVTITWTLRNDGANPAIGSSSQAVYASSDSTWDTADPLIGIHETHLDLAVGASAKQEFVTTLDAMSAELTSNVPGLVPGNYHFIVRADIRNRIRETDDRNNDGVARTQTSVEVDRLVLDTPASDTWNRSESRYYVVEVEEGLDLRLSLQGSAFTANELYVAYGRVATPSDFDLADTGAESPRKQVIIPSTKSGRYYVLVRSERGSSGGDSFDLLAEGLSFSVVRVEPPFGGNRGWVSVSVEGAGFRPTSRVFLRGQGVERELQDLQFESTTEVRGRWNLEGLDIGLYDVAVTNLQDDAVLPEGFDVQPSTPFQIEMVTSKPTAIAAGRMYPYRFRFVNVSNNDIPYTSIHIEFRANTTVEVNTTGRLFANSELAAMISASELEIEDFTINENLMAIPLFARNLAPGEAAEATIFLIAGRIVSGEFPTRVRIRAYGEDRFISTLMTNIEEGRQTILANPGSFDPDRVELARDPNRFASELFAPLVASGLIDLGGANPEIQNFGLASGHSGSWPGLTGSAPSSGGLHNVSVDGSLEACTYDVASCREFFRIVGCAASAVGCATAVSGIGAIVCYMGAAGCAGVPVVGCITDVIGGLSCFGGFMCDALAGAYDPNDMLGPPGYGDDHWISVPQQLPYTIRFENDPDLATAPAQEVFVTHALDSTLDVRSFRLGSFGFAGLHFEVPPNTAAYSSRLDVTDSLDVLVDVAAGVDLSTRTAFWVFSSVDPATGLLPYSPYEGFLPVNDSLGHGEGYVTFTARPDRNSKTGDVIEAQATIVFDTNEPIDTPLIYNTIDAEPPTSRVTFADPVSSGEWNVSWVAEDDEGGSGVRDYTLYVSVDGESFTPYESGVMDPSALYIGSPERLHSFFSVAADNAGNVEGMKTAGDLTVDVESEDLPITFALHPGYPNPFNPAAMLPFDIAQTGRVEIRVFDVIGRLVRKSILGELPPGRYQQELNLARSASGVYLYEIRVTTGSKLLFRKTRKIVLVK
ncbi:MAG: choice-of-anchor D domain-containing protein [Rhodothermales bacterium]|nr:choice-of-anchor D domain-containing protein [Rhodothermales bacterium]